MTALMPRGVRWLEVGAVLALFLVIQVSANETDLASSADCYYNYNHYSEGDRILTNEPCLNCTCHNKMLMCYLKVCPFTKPIGQDCTIEKREDQCCPIITCPEVPVELDHSSAQSTDLAMHQNHGCSIDDQFYPEGAQIPGNPKKPCELCYCIRNMTSCVMQECTLHVDGCRPIYNKGVCCPVRYDCARDDDLPLMLEDQTTTEAPSQGFIITTTSAPVQSTDCYHNGEQYIDGESIDTEQPCEHCYCMRGDIVCAVQECKPLEMHGKNCTARMPGPNECCPQLYECESDIQATTMLDESMVATTLGYRGDDVVLTTEGALAPLVPSEGLEKDAITTEAAIADTTPQRIDESENEIHDKDYHDQMTAKPARTNFTGQQMPGAVDERIEGEDSTTILSKLDDVTATTILSESGAISDEQITTVLPIAGRPQAAEKESTESEGILGNLYTTIKSIVEFTTTLSPLQEQPQKPNEEEDPFLSNVIPGEGDCLDSGISYANNTNVPTRSACEESCVCHNSIVQCEQVKCAPMPPNAENCKILHEEGLCCPSYHCESMEFSTGPSPTHPAESQVIHRGDEPIDSTTLSQPSEIEEQTNAIDSKLDSTTIPSAQPPISSKLDDTYEMKPEATTEAKLEQETSAPEVESLPPVKLAEEMPSEEEPQPTEQPAKEEIATEAATVQEEPESATRAQLQSHTVERVRPDEQSEIMQITTAKSADELPQESATTQLPMQDDSESGAAADEKLHEESQPMTQAPSELTTQRSSEEMVTEQKMQQEAEISTEAQPAAQPEDQKEIELATTGAPVIQKEQEPEEISTEQQPAEEPEEEKEFELATTGAPVVQKQEEIGTTEGSVVQKEQPEIEISTEAQPAVQPEEEKKDEFVTTETPAIEMVQPEIEISTEQKPAEQPEIQKEDEFITTDAPAVEKIQEPEEIATEKQPEVQKPEEIVTTEASIDEKVRPEGEISTEAQPAAQPEDQKEIELATTGAPVIQKEQEPEEISTEQQPVEQPEGQKVDEMVTTEGPSVQKEEATPTEAMPEIQKQDEYVTTERLEQAPEQPSTEKIEEQPIVPTVEEMTTVKLAEEPVEAITSRVSEMETPEKQSPLDSQLSSTEKQQQQEEEYTEKATENLIPDSSTEVEPQKQHEEISTEKQIEPVEMVEIEQMTTEKAAPSEQEVTEQSLPQTTASAAVEESKPSDEPQKEGGEYTTSEPKPIPQEPIATEKQPEYNEIASELPIEDHHIEKDVYVPATEPQPSATEQNAPEITYKKDEAVTDGYISPEITQSPTEAPEKSSTERIAEEEATTLSTSKLNLGGVSPSDFKDGEVVGQDEKQELDVTTERMQQPELSSAEIEKQQPIATEQPTEKFEEIITQAPAISEEKEQATTEKQHLEATTTYVFPSKQEDLEIITEKVIPSKQEDLEMVTAPQEEPKEEMATTLSSKPEQPEIEQITESKAELEPSTQAPIESEVTTSGKVAEEEPSKPAIVEMIPSETTLAPAADEKQPATPSFEQSEQTTFGAMLEKSTEATEMKQEEPIPTTQQPERPELESGSQMHMGDEKQPELPESPESPVTTETSKQEESAITTMASMIPSDNLNRIGEGQVSETTVRSEEPLPVTESTVSSSESPKEEQPHVEAVTTEQNIIDITTLLNKIHDEVTTQRQEQEQPQQPQQQTEEPQQQTEQPQQQTEQPESTSAPVKHDEMVDSEPIGEAVTTEQAISMEKEATTQGVQQAAEIDATTVTAQQEPIDRIHEIPSEPTTVQPQSEQVTQATESSSAQPMAESVQTTLAPAMDEQTTQFEMEKVTESQAPELDQKVELEPTTQKDETSQAPVEVGGSQEDEQAPSVSETTAFELEPAISTTSAPTKLSEPSVSHEELPTEVVTTERAESVPEEEQSTTKPSLFDGTTIKSVVELLTTLHPREPAVEQQESEVTTSQPVDDRIGSEGSTSPQPESYTTESIIAPPESKPSDESSPPAFASPPESSNKIPLIREPSHDEITTKLAESFDTTTLPSILLTSSHTERISDSTTIKNTQNEITDATPQQITEGSMPVDASAGGAQPHEAESQPSFPSPGFDSGYGNVPSQYPDEEYGDEEEPTIFGPGTCRYGGKLYVSAQQIPRDDPCDFCFCFRSDIICLQQSCPPPINGCHEEPIQGFCCPRYECPVSMALVLNSTTTTTTTLPPYLSHFQRNSGKLTRSGCQVQGQTYKIGERVTTASGPCIDCICGGDGQMKCDPKVCTPEPMLRQMIASAKRR